MQLHLKTNSKFANCCSADNSARWSCICREKGRNGGSASLLRDTWYILSVIARYCQVLQERHLVYLVRWQSKENTGQSINFIAGSGKNVQSRQIHCAIWTNTHTDQFHYRLGNFLTSIQTNTFLNLDKYILQFSQIHIRINFIAGSGKKVDLNPFHILLPAVNLGKDVLDLKQFHNGQYFCISKWYF